MGGHAGAQYPKLPYMLQTELADCSTVRVCVTRWGVCRALLVLYLACYLACAGTISNELWSRGGHATPEQWSYHLLLVRLGIHHHHELSAETLDEGSRSALLVKSFLPLSIPVISAPLETPFMPDGTPSLIAGMLPYLVPPLAHRRLFVQWQQILKGFLPMPPEKPPPAHR